MARQEVFIGSVGAYVYDDVRTPAGISTTGKTFFGGQVTHYDYNFPPVKGLVGEILTLNAAGSLLWTPGAAEGVKVWFYDASTYIIQKCCKRFDVYIGGVRVAVLVNNAELWLKGEVILSPYVTETVHTPTNSPNGEIEYVGTSISLAVQRIADSLPIQAAEITLDGDLLVSELETQDYPQDQWFDRVYDWDVVDADHSLDFSVDFMQYHMRLIRTTAVGMTNGKLVVGSVLANAL